MHLSRFIKTALPVLFFGVVLLAAPKAADAAATLYLAPGSGSYTIGQTFTATVRVNTGGAAINAADGFIKYDPSQLAVVGVSRGGSIFNLWTSEPAFSNGAGSISFSGGTTSAYNGNGGAVMTVTFRALREGTAIARFQSGAVLAADGKGTNIVGGLGSGTYVLGAKQIVPPPPSVPTGPSAPQVTSSSHPDQNTWYQNPNIAVAWTAGGGITAVRTLLNHSEGSVPTQVIASAARSQTFESTEDGVWFFHVQLQNENGWGGTAHFRINIDTTDPTTFEVVEIDRDDLTTPRVQFELRGQDAASGIAYYDIQIDGGTAERFEDPDKRGVYATPALGPGTHTILVTAYDAAGNSIVDQEQFSIVAIGPPTITEYTQELRTSDIFVVRGETFQNATVTIIVENEDGEVVLEGQTKSDANGKWTFVADEKLPEGAHKLYATVTDERGASSNRTEPQPVIVVPSFLQETGRRVTNFFAVLVPLIGTLFLLAFLLWYGWHRFRRFAGTLEKETQKLGGDVHKQFAALHTSMKEHVAALEHAATRRELTREEERMKDELNQQLEDAEKAILGEVEGLEKDIEREEHWFRRLIRKLLKLVRRR